MKEGDDITNQNCITYCNQNHYIYAGTEYGGQCSIDPLPEFKSIPANSYRMWKLNLEWKFKSDGVEL